MEKLLRVVNTLALLGILAVLILIFVRLPHQQQAPLTLGEFLSAVHGKDALAVRIAASSNPSAVGSLMKASVVIIKPLDEASW